MPRDLARSRRPLRVHVVALRDCTALVPVGVVEMLRKAARFLGGAAAPAIEVRLVSTGRSKTVTCAGGMQLRCDATTSDVTQSDLVVMSALDEFPQHLEENLDVVPWLRAMFRKGADVASVCTGAFILGEAGLLDGRAATTHWAFQDELARRYPRAEVLPRAILVDQGRVITSGGATSFLNLALHVVERVFDAEAARACSKMFLIDMNKAPQSAYAIFSSQKLHEDREVLRAQSLIEDHPERAPRVEALAGEVGMSVRSLTRRFRTSTGNSPGEYIQRVKVEAAKRSLESGVRVSDVAGVVGYADVAAFRRVFTRITGLTPADYRGRYGPASPPVTVSQARPALSARPARTPLASPRRSA